MHTFIAFSLHYPFIDITLNLFQSLHVYFLDKHYKKADLVLNMCTCAVKSASFRFTCMI